MIPYKTPHIISMVGITVGNGSYIPVAHTQIMSATTTEAYNQTYMFKSGTWSGLSIYIRTANASGDTTFTVRKNGSDTAITLTVPQNSTGRFEDLVNTASVAVGDLISIGVTTSAGTITPTSITVLYETNDGTTAQYFMAHSDTGGSFSANNRYIRPSTSEILGSITSEVLTSNIVQHNSTIEGVAVYVSLNARTAGSTVSSRVNSSSGIGVTIATTSTGMFTNTGSQSITAGDSVNSVFTFSSGAHALTIRTVTMFVVSTNPREITLIAGNPVARNTTNTNNAWAFIGGIVVFSGAGEAVAREYPVTGGVLSGFQWYASANTSTQDLVMYVRKNGADGNENITYTTGSTGWIQDATNSDTIASTDYVTVRTARAASGSGTTTFQHTSIKYTMDPLLRVITI